VARIRRAQLVICWRWARHELFSEAFEETWALLFRDSLKGQPPGPPTCLSLVTLQAYTGASDDEALQAQAVRLETV
jgi:hypothetical protein